MGQSLNVTDNDPKPPKSPERRGDPECRGGRGRHYGSVPPHRRRLFAIACGAVGVAVIASGLVINGVTHSSVRWGWLLVAAGMVMAIYAFYLWVRLSD